MTDQNQRPREALDTLRHLRASPLLANHHAGLDAAIAALTQPAEGGDVAHWVRVRRVFHEYENSAKEDTVGFLTTDFSAGPQRPVGDGWEPLYTAPPAIQEQARTCPEACRSPEKCCNFGCQKASQGQAQQPSRRDVGPIIEGAVDRVVRHVTKYADSVSDAADMAARMGIREGRRMVIATPAQQPDHAPDAGKMIQQPSGGGASGAPERIWLQINADGSPEDAGYPSSHEGVTWCWHSIGGQEVEYVLADTAHRQQAGEEQWQPIETAPKDGTIVDLWVHPRTGTAHRLTDVWWTASKGWRDGACNPRTAELCKRATHWARPLAPPLTTAPAQEGGAA